MKSVMASLDAVKSHRRRFFMPIQKETCIFSVLISGCVTEPYTPGIAAAAGLIGTGTLLATVWSDVPANSLAFTPLRGGGKLTASFGF